ncbi:MAG: hypothetical protein LAO06_02600 [Acidobacteriia bacterium]|nr:hypothetical protein [Terriglobia bacterium]
MKRYAGILFLLAALAGQAQEPPRTPTPRTTAATSTKALVLTPAFKSAAEAALDVIDTAGWNDDAPEIVFATQLSNARNELNHAKREVRTRQDAIAAQKLLRLFGLVDLCRSTRKVGAESYKECLAQRGAQYDDAAAAIGAKTWKIVNELAGP